MTDNPSPPLLSYGVSRRRVKRLRGAVVLLVVAALLAVAFDFHRPVLQFGQRKYHSWALPRAMGKARDAAAADDRETMTAAWRRLHTHRRGRFRGTGKAWRYAPPDVANILFVIDRPTGTPGEIICVGMDPTGIGTGPYLFFEAWATAQDGELELTSRHDVHIRPDEIVPRLTFIACTANPGRANEVRIDFITDARPGVVIVDLAPNARARVSGDAWTAWGDEWHPGPGEMQLQLAPPATWEVKVGRDFAGVRLPDNEHIEVARGEPNEVFVFPIRGNGAPTTRQALTVLGGAQGALYAEPDPPPGRESIDMLARFGGVSFAADLKREAPWHVFRTTPDGRLAAMNGHSAAYVWTNTLPGVAYYFSYGFRGSLGTANVALSPDGTTLAVVCPEWTTALVWDLRGLPGLAPLTTQPTAN